MSFTPTNLDETLIPGQNGRIADTQVAWAAINDLTADAVAKRDLVFNVRDYGATGNGSTDDRAAIVSAMTAATAAGLGRIVFLPPGIYRIDGTLSLSGQTCQLQGSGATYTGVLGAATGDGAVLKGTNQTGPVLDFVGYTWPVDHRGKLSFGNFVVEGDNTADATKAHTGIRLGRVSPSDSPGGARFHDIVIAKTGGPCLDLARVYLCEFDRITCVTPVSAKANDVPYIQGKNVNANEFSRIGLRSISSSADVGASGAVIIEDDGTYPTYGSKFADWWYEYLHPPTNGSLFKLKANSCVIEDFSFSDCTPDTSATNTAYFRIEPGAVANYGGNMIRGLIPAGNLADTVNYLTYGVVVSQPRNSITGVKGYRGSNVRLISGSDNTFAYLAGAYSAATDPAFIVDAGTGHVLIDEYLGVELRPTPSNGTGSRRIISGAYYGPGPHVVVNTATTNNRMTALPMWVPAAFTAISIDCNVTTAAASTNIRLGIYSAHATTDKPDALVLDAGTVDASTTGLKQITISQALSAGLYWLVAVPQGGAPTVNTVQGSLPPVAPTAMNSGAVNGYFLDSITGALPNPFGGATPITTTTKVMVKAT